jgi:hypothetical protein
MPLSLLVLLWCLLGLAMLLALRLARSAQRARSLPEALMALFFFGGAGLGYGTLLLRPTLGMSLESFEPLWLVAETGLVVPPITVAVFTWRVFRAEVAWARRLAIGLVFAAIAVHVLACWLAVTSGGRTAALATHPGAFLYWSGIGIRAAAFSWACAEASSYYAAARRRARLGLADPLVVNRFLLWACWSGLAAVLLLLRVIGPFVVNTQVQPPGFPTWLIVLQAAAGLVCVSTVWLTFAPPAFYRRRLIGETAAFPRMSDKGLELNRSTQQAVTGASRSAPRTTDS